jgi:hypothetical protein
MFRVGGAIPVLAPSCLQGMDRDDFAITFTGL